MTVTDDVLRRLVRGDCTTRELDDVAVEIARLRAEVERLRKIEVAARKAVCDSTGSDGHVYPEESMDAVRVLRVALEEP